MKIINNEIERKFCELKRGEIFQTSDGNVFLKIDFDYYGGSGEKYNAVVLAAGLPVYIDGNEMVFPKPNTEVILKG